MTAGPTFTDILSASAKGWCARQADESVLSLALPIKVVDPLLQMEAIAAQQQFRFAWDCSPGLSIAAAGKCQHFYLSGPRRFDLAQRFSDITLGRLVDVTPVAPIQARPRILLAFSFFEQSLYLLSSM